MGDGQEFDQWLTTKQAAELTGYTSALIRYLARNGHIKAQKFGRDWMVGRKSVEAYAEKMERLGTAKHDPTRAWAE